MAEGAPKKKKKTGPSEASGHPKGKSNHPETDMGKINTKKKAPSPKVQGWGQKRL